MATLQSVHEFASKLNAFTMRLNETKDPADDILRDANVLYETAEKIIAEVGFKSIYFDRMSVEYFSFLDGYTEYLFGSDNDEDHNEDEYESDNEIVNVNEKDEIDVDLILKIAECYFEGYDAYGPYVKERSGDNDDIFAEVFNDYSNVFNTLLSCYKKIGDLAKAKKIIQKEIDRQESAGNMIYDDDLGHLYEDLGRINGALGDTDGAIEAAEKALSLIIFDDYDPAEVIINCFLWEMYLKKGDYENALKNAHSYSNYIQWTDGEFSDEASESLVELAELYLKAGDLHSAEFNLDRAIRNYDPESGYIPNWLPYAYSVYSKFYAAKGDQIKAKESLEKAYVDSIEIFGEDDERTQSIKEQLTQN